MIYNFNPGPAPLPEEVLRELQEELRDFESRGYSLLEASHRSPVYEKVHHAALEALRDYLSVPDSMRILFLAGGASLQFAMLPMNFLKEKPAGFVVSGAWSQKAAKDAAKIGNTRILWSGEDTQFTTLPPRISGYEGCAYVHITSNETIHGVQWHSLPDLSVPLTVDMSSDLGIYPIDWSRIALAYAGSQKNLGTAGLTVVIINEALLEQASAQLPAYLSYKTHYEKNSLYNTPPVYAVRIMERVVSFAQEQGGIVEMERRNREKANLVYNTLEKFTDVYRISVSQAVRSRVSIVCNLSHKALEAKFLEAAKKAGFMGLGGHRSLGGIRISLYNAVPLKSVHALCSFMSEFASQEA